MTPAASNKFVIALFLAMLAAPGLWQTAVEVRRGEWPWAFQVFTRIPTPESLRSYEKTLEEASAAVRCLRPWMQMVQFLVFREAGDKALVGRDGWLFYQPGVNFLTQRSRPPDATPRDASAAVVHFRDSLAARGIRLLIMPAPNKESVYPEQLSPVAGRPSDVLSGETLAFLSQCRSAGVEVVDLFSLFRDARTTSTNRLYLRQDSHWSPAGMEMAARAVAGRILAMGSLSGAATPYRGEPAPVKRLGDLVRMLRSPELERRVTPEEVGCSRVVHAGTGAVYADERASEVLVMGDSFLRIYEQDEPGSAGFVAHLAQALGRPLSSIINDGGASTLVRQELFRHPERLAKTKVVVWEFVERDLRLGTEGWQLIGLGSSTASEAPRPETTRNP